MTLKILTVDDSRIVRMLVTRALQGCDCQIVEASNGEEGLATAAREMPDLILLDVTMPVMDGFEMLKRLRQQAGCTKVPVIMLTAESSQDSVARADGLGVSGYVAKPFKEDLLRERIGRVVPIASKN
jgi:two-component system cell cycle response regulator